MLPPSGLSPRLYETVAWSTFSAVVVLSVYAGCRVLTATAPERRDDSEAVPLWDTGVGIATDSVPERVPAEDFERHCDITPPEGFSLLVEDAGTAMDINPRLIALTVYRESRCKADAIGAVGEIGLGQVYPAIWTKVLIEQGVITSVDDLYDPAVNLIAVGFILSEAFRYAKGDPVDALRRYNGTGPAAERYAREQSALYQAMWGESVWFRHR